MEHVRSRRSPKCARCRNHGFSVPLRGHAGRCRFARCACWKCALITERTRITARQREVGATLSGITEPDGEADRTFTELQVAVREIPRNPSPSPSYTCTRAPESAGLRVQCDYYIPQTPLSAVYSADLPVAMPLPLHGRYAGALAHPGFMVSLAMPALGPVTFPHVPPAALVEHRQEAPGFFYVPYLPHPHPDLHQPGVWEQVDDVVVSPLRDSGLTQGSQQRSSTPPEGAFHSTQE